MKIFLSWSGPRSRAIAEALNDWLRRIIQAVKPFYSPEIEKGVKWSSEIDDALEGTSFGIVCLTPDNLASPWIHFEAGALSKAKDAKIWTFLHGLTPADVPPPLGKFQHTVAEKEDTLLLVKTINRRLDEVGGESLNERLLEDNFETFWPQLKAKLDASQKVGELQSRPNQTEKQRDERAILNEILESVRNQERRLTSVEASLALRNDQPQSRTQTLPLGEEIGRLYFEVQGSVELDLKGITLLLQRLVDTLESKNRIEVILQDRSTVKTLLLHKISVLEARTIAFGFAKSLGLDVGGTDRFGDKMIFWLTLSGDKLVTADEEADS
jgi:TIR domain